MASTVQSNIDELMAIAVAEAQFAAESVIDLSKTVTRMDVAPGQISVKFPYWAAATAEDLTQGSEATDNTATTAGPTLTPDTNAVYRTLITDVASYSAPQAFAGLGRTAGLAIQDKINQDIFALYDGFSTSIGASGTDLSLATVRVGVKKLQQAKAVGPFVLAITPEVAEDLLTDLATYNAGAVALADQTRAAILGGQMPQLYGVTIAVTTSQTDETGDVLKCGLYSRSAIAYAVSWEFKAEIGRRTSYLANDFVMSNCYAVAELIDTHGVEIVCDGAD